MKLFKQIIKKFATNASCDRGFMKNQLQNKIVFFLLIILVVILFSVIGMANKAEPPPFENTQQEEVSSIPIYSTH